MARPPKPFVPANSSYVLLVEGDSDKHFFNKICSSLFEFNSKPDIQVAPPKDFGGKNSKGGVFERLPFLLKQLKDGELEKLAVVVDADCKENHGLGRQKTIEKIAEIVAAEPYFFKLKEQSNGFVFETPNGLQDLGLWVMPNNRDETGMLEDFIKACVKTDEQALFNHAVQVVQAIPEPKKFEPHHLSKAEVATWLAWQKPPGHGLYYTVHDDLLDTDHALFKELENWLKQIFA